MDLTWSAIVVCDLCSGRLNGWLDVILKDGEMVGVFVQAVGWIFLLLLRDLQVLATNIF